MQKSIIFILYLSSFHILPCISKTVTYDLKFLYISSSPDGVYKDKVFAINGQFPGPVISAEIGDYLEVKVTNEIQDRQTIKCHHLKMELPT